MTTKQASFAEILKTECQNRIWITAALLTAGIIALATMAGCSTTPQPMTRAAVTGAVSLGVQIGTERYPESVPYIRAATPVVCSAADGTNIQPAEIVAALQPVVTNDHAKMIINGAVVIYDVIFESYGTNWIEHQAYLKDILGGVCDGLTQGLPTPQMAAKAHLQPGRTAIKSPYLR